MKKVLALFLLMAAFTVVSFGSPDDPPRPYDPDNPPGEGEWWPGDFPEPEAPFPPDRDGKREGDD